MIPLRDVIPSRTTPGVTISLIVMNKKAEEAITKEDSARVDVMNEDDAQKELNKLNVQQVVH